MVNTDTGRLAIEFVMKLERDAGRSPADVSHRDVPYDIFSAPRKIEVKAFGRSARGEVLALDERQVAEARQDPEHFYLYVVDHVTTGDGTPMAVRVIHGALLAQMLDRTPPTISYWPTLRVREYDELIPVS